MRTKNIIKTFKKYPFLFLWSMASLAQKLNDTIQSLRLFEGKYINSSYNVTYNAKEITFLYKVIRFGSNEFNFQMLNDELKYKTFLTETDVYVYVEHLLQSLSFNDNILTIKFKYTILPKVTYFETIPEDLIYEILTFIRADPGFIGSSESVKKVFKLYLNKIVNGYVNIFDPIEVDKYQIKEFIRSINYNKNYGFFTDSKDSIGIISPDDVKEVYYMSHHSNEIQTVIGKLKNNLYFSFVHDLYGDAYRGFQNTLIYSKEWKYIWDHLDEYFKSEIYNDMGYTQFFYLINKSVPSYTTL